MPAVVGPPGPMPTTAAILMNRILDRITTVLSYGYANTVGDAFTLMFQLMIIALIISAIGWGLYRHPVLKELFWKMLGFAVLMYLVVDWMNLSNGLRNTFIQWGLNIGGNALTLRDITEPGNIADFGFAVTAVVFKRIKSLSFWSNSSEILYSGLTSWLVVMFYCLASVQVFMAILEYALVSAALILLVPFLAFEKTAFIGERVFGTIVGHALRLLLLAAVLNIFLPVLMEFELSKEPQFQEVFLLFLVSLTFLAMMIGAQMLAYGLIHGTPVLSAQTLMGAATSVMQTAAVVGAVGAAASLAGAGAIRGGFSAYGAMREAASVGQASYRSSHPFTHASRQGRINTMVVGSAQGVGQYALNRLTSGFTNAIRQGRTRARQHLP